MTMDPRRSSGARKPGHLFPVVIQVRAENHGSGADANVDPVLEQLADLLGEVVDDNAIGQVDRVAALRVDDIRAGQAVDDVVMRQAAERDDVEFAPPERVQAAQVFKELAVVTGYRQRRSGDDGNGRLSERLASSSDKAGTRRSLRSPF